MISVIDMPPADESVWWRGKRGFEVGFFPCECVEVIGDKVPRGLNIPGTTGGSSNGNGGTTTGSNCPHHHHHHHIQGQGGPNSSGNSSLASRKDSDGENQMSISI